MSLSQEPAFTRLRNRYVCGYRNIIDEPYAGDSGVHMPTGNAVDTTNGAGPHNIQMFVMTPDGVVLHCLPGYWNSADLVAELDLAERLNYVWQQQNMPVEKRKEQFSMMQLAHTRSHSADMVGRSQLQGFDQAFEARHRRGASDAIKDARLINPNDMHPDPSAFKTTDQMLHERMAKRPFLSYGDFDVASYSDYGTHVYDKHEDNRDEGGGIANPEAHVKTMRSQLHQERRHRALQRPHVQQHNNAQQRKAPYVRTYLSH